MNYVTEGLLITGSIMTNIFLVAVIALLVSLHKK